ncbi:MAG: anhydro-N-acetylmuramic acid kinase [Bacteroidota bacterium]
MIIAGVMSGSSLDGLDIAIVQFGDGYEWQMLWCKDYAYSEVWVERLKDYSKLSASDYIKLKFEYSKYIGNCLQDVLEEYGKPLDYVSFHGHTLMHLPEDEITEQIGNGGVIAALLDIPTLTDFRIQDVIKGGVGTPLAPLVESKLFPNYDYYVNLGGIANITHVEDAKVRSAYDICPCNQVLNHFANQLGQPYDKDGVIARSGQRVLELESVLNAMPYFAQAAPKSLDNNWIQNEFLPEFPAGTPEDLLFTYTNWMASCIANEIPKSDKETSLLVSGGGAHNTYFMDCLKGQLDQNNCTLVIPAKEIIDYKEAILMALMAKEYLQSKPNVFSAVTGASSNSVGGALHKVLSS